MSEANKTLVMIPTYNEVDNVAKLAHQIIDLQLPCDILFIDDNSPDGTGEKLDRIKGMQGGINGNPLQVIHVIHRSGKLGVGSAHKTGIEYAYARGYDVLVTMDCDGTHNPKDIPEMVAFTQGVVNYDIVVGTRHLWKESLEGWSIWRKFVTHMGHLLTQFLLNMPYDATGAFRAYHLTRLPKEVFGKVESNGYSFFFESLSILNANGYKIQEIPIVLEARAAGHSKLKTSDLIMALLFMVKLRLNMIFRKSKYMM